MSYGDVFCSKCQCEVFQRGEWPNRKWMHLDDKTDMCAGADGVYAAQLEQKSDDGECMHVKTWGL